MLGFGLTGGGTGTSTPASGRRPSAARPVLPRPSWRESPPASGLFGYRTYRIAAILRAKEAGFSLEDIHAVIEADDPAQRRRILRRHRADLARRITQAQASLRIIDAALGCRHDDFTRCPDYRASLADRVGARPFSGKRRRASARPPVRR